MARFKIICGKFEGTGADKKFKPNTNFNGQLHGLQFVNGVAETDNQKGAKYTALDLGYQLVDTEAAPADPVDDKETKKK